MPKEKSKKRRPAARASSGKVSRLDGLNQSRKIGPTGYSVHTIRETNVKKIPLASGKLNSHGILEFQLRLGHNEWGRFLDAPFAAKYYITVKNTGYTKPAEGAPLLLAKGSESVKTNIGAKHADYKYTERVVVMPSLGKKDTGVFFPPELGFSCFYSHCEVFVDSQKIGDETDMMGQNKVYQAFNRIYSNPQRRSRVNQLILEKNLGMRAKEDKITMKDDAAVKTKEITKTQMKLCRTTNFDHFERWSPMTNHFTMDGNFAVSPPLASSLSILRGLDPESNTSGYFPPGTVFTIRLHPRPNQQGLLQFLDQNKFELMGKDKAGLGKDTRIKDVGLEIIDMHMLYESLILPDEASSKQMSRTLNYPFNRVKIDICSFEANHQQIISTSRVPPGAKAMYFTFMKEEHLWYNQSANQNMMNFMHFPDDLVKLKLTLTNHGPLLAKDGFTRMNHEERCYSDELASYFMSQIDGKGVSDLRYSEMFPYLNNRQESLTQSLFVDLQKYRLKTSTEIVVQADYEQKLSPSGTRIVIFYVFDQNLKRSSNGEWTLQTLL